MRQIEELMTWETWLAREPAIDRPRGEWLAWLDATPATQQRQQTVGGQRPKGPWRNQSRHEVRRQYEPGGGFTWCGRTVERGGPAVPWCFASGQVATEGVRPCKVSEAAKTATRHQQPNQAG